MCIHASSNLLELPEEEEEAVLPPVSLHIFLPLAAYQAFHFPPHKPPLGFFRVGLTGSESSNRSVYVKRFSSDQPFYSGYL